MDDRTPPLGARTAAGHAVPARPPAGTGIVHLGLGNFHRAHQAVYTAAALAAREGPWGIAAFAMRSPHVAAALVAQDLRYSVLTMAPDGASATVPAVLTRAGVAAERPEAVLDLIAAPATRIVTLTVTEKGYTYAPGGDRLDLDDPGIRSDLAGAAPVTPIGLLARGLQRRSRRGGGPIAVASCDNLAANGRRTGELVSQFVAALPAAERDELLPWLHERVGFPSSMVDRIVPATTDRHRALAAELLGAADRVPVPAEPFTMWALEDRFPAGRPVWEAGGALFTTDIEAYELLKLRLLNGTHSLIAYLGLRHGAAHISDAIRLPAIERAARAVMLTEYLPTFRPPDIDVDAYTRRLFDRFGNTAIAHRTSQVGSDGSLKLPVRITEPVLWHAARGRVPRFIALTVAGFVECLASGGAAATVAGAVPAATDRVNDPAAGRVAGLARAAAGPDALATAVFHRGGIFDPRLAELPDFVAAVGELAGVLRRHGVAAAVRAAAGE